MKFEINHRLNGSVLFSLECDSLKLCVIAAVQEKAYLRGADLSGADLSEADLSEADLRGADLREADLSEADLSEADLSGADLRGADLSGAYLRGADLSGADLREAYLSGAYLREADLSEADLAAQLGQPNGWHAWTYVSKEGEQRVRVGCQDFTIADGRAYWNGKENRREVMAALDYAESIGKLRAWGEKKLEKSA